jgi:hypothetical protein
LSECLCLLQYTVEGVSDEEDVLDCGVLSESDIISKMFTVHNVNPIEVRSSVPVVRSQ